MVIDLTSTSSHSMSREKISAQRSTEATKEGASKPATNVSSTPQDTFQLSNTAKALRKADERIANSPDVDAEKVASLKAAIADGSYEINFQNVADKMLSFESQIS